MTALHDALKTLGPTEFSTVPQDPESLAMYLKSAFQSAQIIIDSVPLPPSSGLPTARSRTVSEASNSSEIASSAARSELLDPENAPLQKEWGKPLKLNAKDNPLDITAYKLAGKDGNGAWFARRSVHEGMGFKRWKLGLEREFPETLEVQGGPGEGNIRGIGGEKRVETMLVPDVGTEEVYHLTAQFPGPSSPRDFVTLLLTSSNALIAKTDRDTSSDNFRRSGVKVQPRHYMVISRPCIHPDCPPRSGFVRGQYESVEFIREVPRRPKKAASALNLPTSRQGPASVEKEAPEKNATNDADRDFKDLPKDVSTSVATQAQETRKRSITISGAASRSFDGKAEDENISDDEDEQNPVEWVMITRSDPGGSVPRFMVERGTPGSIVADAGKFLDWATKKEHLPQIGENAEKGDDVFKHEKSLEALETNGHLAGLNPVDEIQEGATDSVQRDINEDPSIVQESQSGGMLASMTNVALSGIENYAPQAVIDRLPGHTVNKDIGLETSANNADVVDENASSSGSSSPTASFVSFSGEEDNADEAASTESPSSSKKAVPKDKQSPEDRELARLNDRKRQLNEKLAKTKEKETKDREELTSREEQRIKKAEEKHAREVAKQEERYAKQMAKFEAKKRKTEDKDDKTRLTRENQELRQQLDAVKKERDMLKEQVGLLQKENTSLVVRLGKFDEGKDLLKEVKAEVLDENRSRSSSLRRLRPGTPDKAREVTVVAKESSLKEIEKPG